MLQIHLTSLDFTLLSAFAPFWVYNDMTARKWWAFGNSWVLLSHFKLWNPLLEEFITITFICLSQVWQRFLASSLISGTIFRSSVVPCPKAITNNNANFTQPHCIQVWMRITFFDSHKIFTFFVLMSIASLGDFIIVWRMKHSLCLKCKISLHVKKKFEMPSLIHAWNVYNLFGREEWNKMDS